MTYRTIPCIHLPLDFASTIADNSPSPEAQAIQSDTRELFSDVLAVLLSARDAAIMHALYFEDTSTKDTAARFGMSVKRIESVRTSALKSLRSVPNIAALLRPTATR